MNKALKLALYGFTSFAGAVAGTIVAKHIAGVMGYEPGDWNDGAPCVAKKQECVYGMSECPMAKKPHTGEAHHMFGTDMFGKTQADVRWLFCPFGRTDGCPHLESAVPDQTCTHAWQDDCVSGQEALKHGKPGDGVDHVSQAPEGVEPTFCPYGWLNGCNMLERHDPYSVETCVEAGYECCPAFLAERAEKAEARLRETEGGAKQFCPFGEVGCFSPDDFEAGVETCPCADEGCVRKHTITEPGHDAFGGSYGGHGRHAEEVAFGQESEQGEGQGTEPDDKDGRPVDDMESASKSTESEDKPVCPADDHEDEEPTV